MPFTHTHNNVGLLPLAGAPCCVAIPLGKRSRSRDVVADIPMYAAVEAGVIRS